MVPAVEPGGSTVVGLLVCKPDCMVQRPYIRRQCTPKNYLCNAVLGQLPLGQLPPGQLPRRTITPIGQLPRGQLPPGQLPPRTITPVGQLPWGQLPLLVGQLPLRTTTHK